MKRALVTGGCGFLGSAIVRALLARGVEVRVLVLPGEPTRNLEGLEVEQVPGDVLVREEVSRAVAGVDTVFHAAAIYKAWLPDPMPMYEVSLRGTINVLEAARRADVEKVVCTASIVALGRPPPGELGDEQTHYEAWEVDFHYSRSKVHSRVVAEALGGWGLDVRVVCPGVVFGPGDVAPTPSGKLIINTLKGGTPPVYVDGGASYVDVRDAAEVHVLAAERGRRGERYLATAHNLDNLQLFEAICRAAGVRRRYFRVPVPVARRLIAGLELVARRTGTEPPITRSFFEYSLKPAFYSNQKAVSELGARFRPLDEALRDAVGDFRARGLVPPAPTRSV